MNEQTKQIIALFSAIVLGIVIVATSVIIYARDEKACVISAAQSGWTAKDAQEACK